MTRRGAIRSAASLGAVVLLVGLGGNPAAAWGVPAAEIDPGLVPADVTPGPGQPMRQARQCAQTVVVAAPDVAAPPPGHTLLDVVAAWEFSTGADVPVAVIDTGVTPNPRLPVAGGGDYVAGGDGLSDCDAHGTVVASIIAAAPHRDPAAPDGVVGVAPDARIISIRQSSRAYEFAHPQPGDHEAHRQAGTLATLAAALVHAANLGAKVINVSVTACVPAADPLDQRGLGAALWYAAVQKDAVVVAAAGNEGEEGCAQNPATDPLDVEDPRGWQRVRTVSSPSWFSDYVLAVGGIDSTGTSLPGSLTGPWIAAAAPGTDIVGLSPQGGAAVNAYAPAKPGEPATPFWGTSFSAAYVSGIAALVRARFPELTAHQVINRILRTAHNPAAGIDNRVGYGVVDPVAALTFDVPPGDPVAPSPRSLVIAPPAPPPPPDRRAHAVAMVVAALAIFAGLGALGAARLRRAR